MTDGRWHRRTMAAGLALLLAGAPSSLPAEPPCVQGATWVEMVCTNRAALRNLGVRAVAANSLLADGLEREYPVETDWLRQAGGPDVLARLLADDAGRAVLEWIEGALPEAGANAAWRADLQRLREGDATAALAPALELFGRVCTVRRALRLRELERLAPVSVFARHYNLGGSHYAYTEGQSDAQAERHFVPGAALCLLRVAGGAATVETLFQDPGGVIRNPDVSPDGKRALFAWKRADRTDDYHLYEMELATRNVRQLTAGEGVADYEGAYLADGDILFTSTRCVQTVDCWWTEVSNLYRCTGDGQLIRRLTFDQVHDNFPTLTADGRILYTRWEYNDRGQVYPQPLLQMNPDGTGQAGFYGVNSWFPTTILHARGLPGSARVLAIATGHHSRQAGKLILIDPARGREEAAGVQLVAPVRETKAVRVDSYGQDGALFQFPYPLGADECLVTYHPVGWAAASDDVRRGRRRDRDLSPRFGIYWMHFDGRRECLAADPDLSCNQAVPVRPRALHARPTAVRYGETNATIYVQDIYAGPGLAGVPRGTVRTLRVVALDFRAAGIGMNSSGGPAGGALASTPVSIGNGAWDPKRVLGDVPVESDGSVFCVVPAREPIYFMALDAQGCLVQTMRSWTTLQPGENGSCVGCHEDKNSVPLHAARPTLALRAGARPLAPFQTAGRGFSFPRDVQPVLDRHCVRCHTGEKEKPFSLAAAEVLDPKAKRRWTAAYLALTHARPREGNLSPPGNWVGDADHPVVNWISAQSVPTLLPPRSAGSGKSRLLPMLDAGHGKVQLAAAERAALAAWLDLGVPFCGDYREAHAWDAGEVDKYRSYEEKRVRLAADEAESVRQLAREM